MDMYNIIRMVAEIRIITHGFNLVIGATTAEMVKILNLCNFYFTDTLILHFIKDKYTEITWMSLQ